MAYNIGILTLNVNLNLICNSQQQFVLLVLLFYSLE